MTIAQQQQFIERLKTGWAGDCECCGRYAKMYKRRLHKGIALALINLYHLDHKVCHHYSQFCNSLTGSDFTLAWFWDLIIPGLASDIPPEMRTTGRWQISQAGINFVEGLTSLLEYALLYNDTLLAYEGDPLTIRECLGNKFNYYELMKGARHEV